MPAVNTGARTVSCLFAALALSCSSTAKERPYKSGDDPPQPILPAGTEPVVVEDEADAPEISRSVGSDNGILVMWPRIVLSRSGPPKPDDETRAIAGRLQTRVAEIVRGNAAGKTVELRPEPERVCPRSGCKAMSVGILLARAGKGCAAAVLISGPGTAPARIVPWLGSVTANRASVPFREPPESAVDVKDYVSCASVANAPGADADVTKAIAEMR
jgi:hypothetical protein